MKLSKNTIFKALLCSLIITIYLKSAEIELHEAIIKGDKEKVKCLLTLKNFIYYRDAECNTPLHLAVDTNNLGIAQLLLENKVCPDETNIYGYTPLHLAVFRNNLEAVKLLVKNKANVNCEDNNKFTPLIISANKGYRDILRFLIKNKAEISHQNSYGNTALHLALYNRDLLTIRLLLRNGANPKIKNQDQITGTILAYLQNIKII